MAKSKKIFGIQTEDIKMQTKYIASSFLFFHLEDGDDSIYAAGQVEMLLYRDDKKRMKVCMFIRVTSLLERREN